MSEVNPEEPKKAPRTIAPVKFADVRAVPTNAALVRSLPAKLAKRASLERMIVL